MKGLLQAGINDRFGAFINWQTNLAYVAPYLLATATDWRTKSLAFASHSNELMNHIAGLLLQEAESIDALSRHQAADQREKLMVAAIGAARLQGAQQPRVAAAPPPAAAGGQDDLSFFVCGPAPPDVLQAVTMRDSVVAFFNTPGLTSLSADPAPLWQTHKATFPAIFRVYCKYACLQGSTAIAERLFSDTGNLHERKRCRWLPENLNAVIFCSKNEKELAKIAGEDEDGED